MFFLFIVISNDVHGSEATGEKAEFNYFPAKKTLLVFLVLKRFILREPETAHRVYVLITGGQEFESRRKDSLGT